MAEDRPDMTSEQLAEEAAENGLMYNVAYEIENFFAKTSDDVSALSPKYMNDGKVNGFKLFFHFDATSGLLADEGNTNSALAYLKRLKQTSRYNLLKKFINILSVINSQTPWMFQEIESGLKELWTSPLNNVLKDQIIQIKMLETIDDKIQGLMHIYRLIVWDESRDVWVVPVNLRQFSMSIYVYDYRYFHDDSVASVFLQTKSNMDVKNFNHTLFDLGFCEFALESGGEAFDGISNNASEFVNSSLYIQTKQVAISGLYKTLFQYKHTGSDMTEKFVTGALTKSGTGILPDDLGNFDQWKTNLKDYLIKRAKENQWYKDAKSKYDFLTNKNTWRRELGNVIDNSIATIENKLNNQIAQLYLGNVYGFSLSDFVKYGDSGSILSDLQNTVRKNQQLSSLSLDDDIYQQQGTMGNIYEQKDISLTLDDDHIQKPFDLGQST